jgi:uncharacterized protein with von Willebrand factor type A (vWA) domain
MSAARTAAAYTAEHERHVFEVSRWQRYLWTQRLEASRPLRCSVGQIERVLDGDDVDPGAHEARRGENWGAAEEFGGEVFARLYNDPQKLDDPEGPAWMSKVHDLIDGMAEFETLRQSVRGDADFAALASKGIVDRIASKLPELLKDMEANEENGGADEGTPTSEDRMRAAIRAAARGAAEDVNEMRTALGGLAPGLESAPPQHEQGDARRMQLAERLRNDPSLREVLKRAGRIARIASKKNKVRNVHAREEVVDIERGGDVARILPAQMARLRHPKARLLMLRDIVERTAVQYRLEGKEPQGRGPIVVMVDESGSMSGEPLMWASAVAIAAVGQGAKEKRAVTVIGFDTQVTSAERIDASGKGYVAHDGRGRESYPRPDQWKPIGGVADVVLRVAGRNVHGGTSFDGPVRFALECGLREERADFIFVTDGQAAVSPSVLAELEAAKAKGLRVFGVIVNGGSTSPAVKAICTEVVDLDRATDKGKALGEGVM